jgi:hypothetical protein
MSKFSIDQVVILGGFMLRIVPVKPVHRFFRIPTYGFPVHTGGPGILYT